MKSEQHGLEATKPAKEVKKPHSVGRGGHWGVFPELHPARLWAALGPGSAMMPSVTLDELFSVSGPWETGLGRLLTIATAININLVPTTCQALG